MISYRRLFFFLFLSLPIFKLAAADGGCAASETSCFEEAPCSEGWRSKPLEVKPDGSIASHEILNSAVYSDKAGVGPLEVIHYHPYNPTMPHKVIALKLSNASHLMPESFRSSLSPSTEYFFVIDRPLVFDKEKILLRPHYWMYRGLAGKFNKNERAVVNVIEDDKPVLSGIFPVHVHDYVCSPSNMPLPSLKLGEDAPDESHMLYSLVTSVLDKQLQFTGYLI